MSANDVSFETVQSSKIKTVKLYYKYNSVAQSIGLVFGHGWILDYDYQCHKMLKQGLKLDRVHLYRDLSMSQLEEKITWVIEMTTGSPIDHIRLQEQLALVVIVNIGSGGFFLETEKEHKEYYDYINDLYPGRPQNFPTAID